MHRPTGDIAPVDVELKIDASSGLDANHDDWQAVFTKAKTRKHKVSEIFAGDKGPFKVTQWKGRVKAFDELAAKVGREVRLEMMRLDGGQDRGRRGVSNAFEGEARAREALEAASAQRLKVRRVAIGGKGWSAAGTPTSALSALEDMGASPAALGPASAEA